METSGDGYIVVKLMEIFNVTGRQCVVLHPRCTGVDWAPEVAVTGALRGRSLGETQTKGCKSANNLGHGRKPWAIEAIMIVLALRSKCFACLVATARGS